MTSRRITLSPEELKPLVAPLRAHLKAGGLPGMLVKAEGNPYGLGEKGNLVLSLIEETGALLGSFTYLIEDLFTEEGFTTSRRAREDVPAFPTLAAVSMACGYGARRLDELTDYTVRTRNAFDLMEINKLLREDDPAAALLDDMTRFLQRERPEYIEDLLKALCGWFHLMSRTAASLSLDPRYRRERTFCEALSIHYAGLRFTPFSAPMDQGDQTTVRLPITMEKIIGNREYLDKGRRLVHDLMAFDPTEGKNPKRFNQILFGLGRPGCGKTASANALGNHLLERAAEIGMDARFVVIRRTDWASSYQNASSKALIERFTSALEDFKGVVLFYWPDIDTAFSSRGSGDLRSEEKGILGAAFGLFDGTILPFNGQWGLICDANYMQMDEATVSRLSQDPCVVKGPETPEDYVQLLRGVLLGAEYESSLPPVGDWMPVGDYASTDDLSGRDMANLSRRLISLMEDFPYPEGFFQAPFEKRRDMVRAARRPLDIAAVLFEMERLSEFKAHARVMERREQIGARVDSLALELEAREAFAQKLEEPND